MCFVLCQPAQIMVRATLEDKNLRLDQQSGQAANSKRFRLKDARGRLNTRQ